MWAALYNLSRMVYAKILYVQLHDDLKEQNFLPDIYLLHEHYITSYYSSQANKQHSPSLVHDFI